MSPAWRAWSWLAAVALAALMGVGAIALEAPSGSLEGQVLTVERLPLEGAVITASGPVTRSIRTGRDGRYRFARLPVGAYHLSATARRFEAQWQEGAARIQEAKTLGGQDFRLEHQAPALETAQVQRVFLPEEKVSLGLRGALLSGLQVQLHRVNLEALSRQEANLEALRHGQLAPEGALRDALSPVRAWAQGIPAEAKEGNGWFFHRVEVGPLPEGQYLVEVQGEVEAGLPPAMVAKVQRRAYWFGVSRLALVTKRERGALLAYACDLVSKRPLAGVRLRATAPKAPTLTALTGPDGLAHLGPCAGQDELTLWGKTGASEALVLASYHGYDPKHRILTYTDRPMYRPGQQVHAKAMVKQVDAKGGYLPLRPEQVRLVLRDAKGKELASRSGQTSAFGGFAADFPLPAEAELGSWSVSAEAGDESESADFLVAEYRKPEFALDVVASPTVISGDTLEVVVKGRYLFGAPATGLKLQASTYVSSQPPALEEGDEFFAGYLEGPGFDEAWGYGEELERQEGRTDAEGQWRLRIPTPPMPEATPEAWVSDRRLNVVVEGLDATGRSIKGKLRVNLMQGGLRLETRLDRVVATPQGAVGLELKTKSLEGKATLARGEVRAYRLESLMETSPEGDQSYRTVTHAGPVLPWSSDSQGRAKVTFTGLPEGQHLLEVVARDPAGRPVVGREWLWVAKEGAQEAEGTWRPEALRLVLDRKVYTPGQTAQLLIAAPKPGLHALVTVEARSLLLAKVVPLPTGVARVPVRLDPSWPPHASLNVQVVDGKEFLQAQAALNLRPQARFLQLSVSPERSSYHPGEEARFTLRARDLAGRPVRAEVSLGLVDEGIYLMEPDGTPDPRQHFHGPEPSQVETAYSFAEDYAGGLDKFSDDPRVRSRFEDTAAWFPKLVTDAKGEAKVSFRLPDNLTTWIATVRGSSQSHQVGAALGSVLVTKDVVLRLALPRFLNLGDRVEALAIADEREGKAREVQFGLEARGLKAEAALPGPGPLAAKGQRAVALPFTAELPGEARVAAALTEAKGGKLLDALRLSLPVAPFAVAQEEVAVATVAAADPFATTLSWPAGVDPQSLRLQLSWRNSPRPAIAQAMAQLRAYPYACSEQASSRLLAEAISLRLLQGRGPKLPGDEGAKARGQAMVDRLVGLQHGDGGWAWWSDDASRLELSAYALLALAEAKMAGLAVSDEVVKQGLGHLKAWLPRIQDDLYTLHGVQRSAGADARALALLALSKWQQAPGKELAQAVANRSKLSRYGLAQLTWALANAKDPAAGAVAVDLVAAGQESESMWMWPAEGSTLSWQDDDEEATAYGLLALLAAGQDEGSPASKAARYLTAHAARLPEGDTKAQAAALWALAAWQAEHPQEEEAAALTVRLDGQEVEVPVAGEGPEGPVVELGPERLKPDAQQLEVEVAGSQPTDLVLRWRYALPAEGLAPRGSAGLSVQRRYLALSPEKLSQLMGEGEAWALTPDFAKALPEVGPELQVGQKVLAEVVVQTQRSLPFVQLEDPLPAGLEAHSQQPQNAAYPWTHVERHDNRATFFSVKLGPGTHHFYHLLQVSQAGRYRALPPHLRCTYAPEWQAQGLRSALTIRPAQP